MAEITAYRRWADGSVVGFSVEADAESIDCIDMLRPIAVKGLLDAVDEMTAVDIEDDGE